MAHLWCIHFLGGGTMRIKPQLFAQAADAVEFYDAGEGSRSCLK